MICAKCKKQMIVVGKTAYRVASRKDLVCFDCYSLPDLQQPAAGAPVPSRTATDVEMEPGFVNRALARYESEVPITLSVDDWQLIAATCRASAHGSVDWLRVRLLALAEKLEGK